MNRFMLMALFMSLLSLNAAKVLAAQNIDTHVAVNDCIKKYKDQNIECLDDAINRSEDDLNKVYNQKLNELKQAPTEKIWMGNEQQKDSAVHTFIDNQKKWLTYRNSFCTTALWTLQNSSHLGEAQTSCELIMNKRREDELNMILSP